LLHATDPSESLMTGARLHPGFPGHPSYVANLEGFLVSPDGPGVQYCFRERRKSPALFSVNDGGWWRPLKPWAALKASFTFSAPITAGLEVSDWKTSMSPKLEGQTLPLKNESAESWPSCRIARVPPGYGDRRSLAIRPAGKPLWRTRTPAAVWG